MGVKFKVDSRVRGEKVAYRSRFVHAQVVPNDVHRLLRWAGRDHLFHKVYKFGAAVTLSGLPEHGSGLRI